MHSVTDQVTEATKQELHMQKDFLISPFLEFTLLSNSLTHKQLHKLSESHEIRSLKPPATLCGNLQIKISFALWQATRQHSAERLCAEPGGAQLEEICSAFFRTSFLLHYPAPAQGRQPVYLQVRNAACSNSTGEGSCHLRYWKLSSSTFSSSNSVFQRTS